jgi:hypothetical protein
LNDNLSDYLDHKVVRIHRILKFKIYDDEVVCDSLKLNTKLSAVPVTQWIFHAIGMQNMTTPAERTRALRWAGEFLSDVIRNPGLPGRVRTEAKMILRHYPDVSNIKRTAEILKVTATTQTMLEPWLSPD